MEGASSVTVQSQLTKKINCGDHLGMISSLGLMFPVCHVKGLVPWSGKGLSWLNLSCFQINLSVFQ